MAGEVTLAESEFNARMRETARRVLGKLIERRRNSPPGVGRGGERRHSLRIKALPTPSYTERARTQAIAVAGADSGSGPCDANNTSGAANQRRNSVSNWSWEDSDASNDSFGNGESDRRSGGRANVNKGSPGHAPSQPPAGPSFVKVMAPGHISGHFYVDAPCGLSDWLPDETATLVLECDGEEWKTVWLVETKGGDKNAGLSGGWRGFAVDQRLAVGDALVFTKERGARVSVSIHRCGTGGVGRDGGRRTGGARCPPGVRIRGEVGGVYRRRGEDRRFRPIRRGRNVVRRAHRSNAPSPTPMRGHVQVAARVQSQATGTLRRRRRRRGETKDRRFPRRVRRYRANGGGRRAARGRRGARPTASRLAADPRGARRRVAVALETSGDGFVAPRPTNGSAPVRVAQGWDSEEERSASTDVADLVVAVRSRRAARFSRQGHARAARDDGARGERGGGGGGAVERGGSREEDPEAEHRQRGQVPDRVEAAERGAHLGDARRGGRRPREGRIR